MAPVSRSWLQPLDRVALTLMAILAGLTALLLWTGDHTLPKVRDFSWQRRQVGAEDAAFILTFNRLMDWPGVTANLKLTPELPGKTSWTGRRLAYTLTDSIPYGQVFQLKLSGVKEAVLGGQAQPKQMQPFVGQFRSRDRALAYIGVGKEEGRLVLENLTLGKRQVLTPANLVVFDFKAFPEGDRILFSAAARTGKDQPAFDPQLYVVSTGVAVNSPDLPFQAAKPAGEVELVLDNKDYQILKFDLSADGSKIVVQRAARSNLAETGLWLLEEGKQPQKLNTQSGGDFLIAPDSTTLVMAKGQGLALYPLTTNASDQPLDFLPQFGMVLGFARDGSAATMVKFNSDFTRSLYLVNTQGIQKELLRTNGSLLNTQFDPQKRNLYCLLTRLIPGEKYNEQPFLAAINLETGKLTPLLDLAGQGDLQMSLAPDGFGLLFDQIVPQEKQQQSSGANISSYNLWLLPIQAATDEEPAKVLSPQRLASGFHGRWLP